MKVLAFKFTACQEPEQREPEMYDEEGIEQAEVVVLILNLEATSYLTFSERRTTRQGMLVLQPLLMEMR